MGRVNSVTDVLSVQHVANRRQAMSKNLVEKGQLSQPLVIFNRTKKRSEDLSSKLGPDKVKVAESIEDAVVNSAIIFTCVGDDAAIKDTIDNAVKGDVEGKLFVDCSTVHPDTTRALAETVTSKGAEFVASPGIVISHIPSTVLRR